MTAANAEQSIFLTALELATSAERAAYLKGACGADPALLANVQALLAVHDQSDDFLDRSPVAFTTAYRPLTEGPGTVLGPYKLLQKIGEGGFGVVYMAEQETPVRRKVALKIIKPGMDSAQVIARFEAERQVLAMMDHQNIARVFDAGATVGGRPYFVMELIHGVPITDYCDSSKLTPRQRLELFVPVCQAIQHAHQKGIIHRDIKPSNVLVTMYDDKPVPKVIDFGVAKALDQRLTEKTLFTQFGALVGTFEYMSPEQAEMNAFGVDTRSDVYSLGVLLYELLTGTTPLERTRLREAALGELVRLIKEEEAPRPSVRLGSSQNLPKIAAARQTEPAALSKLVRGEIDWIVMKCLEKDRTRRYDSASGLARDVERHLADEPVEACPPSVGYRLSKFARKYRKSLASAAAFVVLLVAGLVVSTLLAVWATSAEREAIRQRHAAEESQQIALDAKAEADKQRDEARQSAYATAIGLAQRAWEEGNVQRARDLLNEVVPWEASGGKLRGFEWHYLSRLFRPELQTLRHTSSFMCVAFSPDGQRVASTSSDGTVKVWETATGKELLSLQGQASWGRRGVAFSPDGRRLASTEPDGTVKVWDSETGKSLQVLEGHEERTHCVAYSSDGRWIASGGEDKTVRIWDSTSGKELHSLTGHTSATVSVAFSPDGRRLASGDTDKALKIWDTATGKAIHSFEAHRYSVLSLAFSPDGRRLASAGDDWHVKLWDSATGKELLSIDDTNEFWSVAFSPDGQRLVTGGADPLLKIWDSSTGKQLFTLKGHAAEVVGVAWSSDGQRLASASHDRTVKIWDAAPVQEPFSLQGHDSGFQVQYYPDGQRFIYPSLSVAYSPDGQRLVSGSQDSTVKIWDSVTGRELLSLKDHSDNVSCVAYSPDGLRIATGSYDKTVRTWNSATGKPVLSLAHDASVYSVAYSPDGLRVASGGDKTVTLWDSVTGRKLFSLEDQVARALCLAFRPNGRHLASGGEDGAVKLWDSTTGKEVLTFEGHTTGAYGLAFSPDGLRLASANWDRTAKVWDSVTGKLLLTLKGHALPVMGVAFSPDGRRLATGSQDGTVRVWDSTTGTELLSLKGRTGMVVSVAFSPDSQRLASATQEGFISFWETTVTQDAKDFQALRKRVADLFDGKGLRADVLEWLQMAPGMSPAQRQDALAIAQSYPEDPDVLHELACDLVKQPGRPASAYRQALRLSEAACQRDPRNGAYLTALGLAHYRVGNDAKALEVFLDADQALASPLEGPSPALLAFLALTQHRLGQAREAQAVLARLRELMKGPRKARDAEAQGFLREAETVLAKPTTGGSK